MITIQQVINAANKVYPDNKILKDLCIVQACHESNLLNKPSRLASDYFNLFGIKKAGTAGTIAFNTTEYINGRKITVKATFGANKSLEDSVLQHRAILSLTRYKSVWAAKSFSEAATEVQKDGYATDGKYTQRLLEIHQILTQKGLI